MYYISLFLAISLSFFDILSSQSSEDVIKLLRERNLQSSASDKVNIENLKDIIDNNSNSKNDLLNESVSSEKTKELILEVENENKSINDEGFTLDNEEDNLLEKNVDQKIMILFLKTILKLFKLSLDQLSDILDMTFNTNPDIFQNADDLTTDENIR